MTHHTASEMMTEIGTKAKAASKALARLSAAQKTDALLAAAQLIKGNIDPILTANARDLKAAEAKGLAPAMIDRLTLTQDRIGSIVAGLEAIAAFPDPVGAVTDSWDRPSGLSISRVRTPLGVIGVIYESRPNVTVDAAALCLKAGNAVILRGGSEAFHSNQALYSLLDQAFSGAGLPDGAVQFIQTTDRALVGAMLQAQGLIDVIIPRGGKSLVSRVQAEARVPVFAHLDGNNHIYIDAGADADTARRVVVNAKMRRTGICGAAETLLIHRSETKLAKSLITDLQAAGCAIRGDQALLDLIGNTVTLATEADWETEYLDAIIAVKMVDSLNEAMDHIGHYGSGHTDCIITTNQEHADRFLRDVDSAIVMHNSSTQFADGGEFGMGAEIGIATGRIHARGPVGCDQLTTFKYQVTSDGAIRP